MLFVVGGVGRYVLLASDLGGSMRFAAAVARRMEMLGALTRGDRRAASCLDFKSFNIGGRVGKVGSADDSRARLCA